MQKIFYKQYILLYILFITFIYLVFSSNPFLKYPFDMYIHLQKIDSQYYIINMPKDRLLWHWMWAKVFYIFNIDNSKVFLRAYIIHYTQTIISFFSIYYFSKVFIKNFFINIDNINSSYLAFWSTIIWFMIYATESMGIHQVWIMWYSLSYQITLPITFVMLGLTISIIFENNRFIYKIYYLIILFILGRIVIQMHIMEMLYYLMYVSVLFVVYLDKIYFFIKRNIYLRFFILLILLFIIYYLPTILQHTEVASSRILPYLSFNKLPELYIQIIKDGNALISGLNRANASMNELIYLSLFLVTLLLIYFYITRDREKYINKKLLVFLVITSYFVLIPVYKFSSGLFGMLVSSIYVVNRFYYSSLSFLVIPIFIYYLLLITNKKNTIFINFSIVFLVIGVFIYSRFDIKHNQNFYKNIKSIVNSFNRSKVGFNLSRKDIKQIGLLKEEYKKNLNITNPYFFAREDIAFILKKVYGENVYMIPHFNGAKLNIYFYESAYIKSKNSNKILFKTPKKFLKYIPYK